MSGACTVAQDFPSREIEIGYEAQILRLPYDRAEFVARRICCLLGIEMGELPLGDEDPEVVPLIGHEGPDPQKDLRTKVWVGAPD